VFVVPGGPTFPAGTLTSADPGVWSLRNLSTSDFGAAVAAGDLDGDGFDELVISIPDDDVGGADAGQVLVLPNAR
jgi:hypothetical protein